MDERRRGLINNIVTAVDDLVNSAIAEKAMGTYYEELALNKAITELVLNITEEVPSGESR